jgi:hypothetical protein
MTHDYKRHGTTTLFAALNVLDGTVIGRNMQRHRTNVWEYVGVNSFREGRLDDLELHPTVKPVGLVADAIKDCSRRGAIMQGPRHLRGALQTPSSFAGTAGIRHSRRGQGCERRALAGPDVTLAIPTHPRVPPIPGDGLLGPDLDLPGVAANLAVLHQAAFHVGLQEEFNGFTAIGAGDLEAVVHVL